LLLLATQDRRQDTQVERNERHALLVEPIIVNVGLFVLDTLPKRMLSA
jgi:hypothetical protein